MCHVGRQPRSNTKAGEKMNPINWNLNILTALETGMDEPQCRTTGSHMITRRDGQPDVQYADGTYVGYCQHCNERIVLTFKPGGLDSVRLDELGARAELSDPDSVIAFREAYEE